MGSDSRLGVTSIEIDRGGLSFTVDTLSEWARRSPHDERFLLMGADVVRSFAQWREPLEVMRLAELVDLATGRGARAAAWPRGCRATRQGNRRYIACSKPGRSTCRRQKSARGCGLASRFTGSCRMPCVATSSRRGCIARRTIERKRMIKGLINKVIGTRHDRERRRIQPLVDEIHEHAERLAEAVRGRVARTDSQASRSHRRTHRRPRDARRGVEGGQAERRGPSGARSDRHRAGGR